MSMKRIGDVLVVENKKRHRLAKATYNYIRIQLPGGEETEMLLTDKDLERGIARARKNPEDLPKVSWIRDITD